MQSEFYGAEEHGAEQGTYASMLPSLNQARFGSYLILPFQYEEGGFHRDWADQRFIARDVTTVDLNEIARSMMSRGEKISAGHCWMVPRDVMLSEMTGSALSEDQTSFFVESLSSRRRFSLIDSWLYVFHSQVAFFALGIVYDEIETLADIVNPGGADSRAAYHYEDASGCHAFSLEDWIGALTSKVGLHPFFSSNSNTFLEVFTHTVAVVPEKFPNLEVMRQATFNIHLMIPFDNPITDNSEEDVRFVYAKIDEVHHNYRWATCVTSQTISYITADPEMDLMSEMESSAKESLPIDMLALYEKFTCLHYTDAITSTDLRHLNRIQKLKMEMLEFQAYGTLAPANFSRWHNIKNIYASLLETNGIPEAIADVDHKIKILSEHQRELESRRAGMLTNLITAFGIISILASVLTIIQILIGGNNTVWIALILTVVIICMVFLLALFRRRR